MALAKRRFTARSAGRAAGPAGPGPGGPRQRAVNSPPPAAGGPGRRRRRPSHPGQALGGAPALAPPLPEGSAEPSPGCKESPEPPVPSPPSPPTSGSAAGRSSWRWRERSWSCVRVRRTASIAAAGAPKCWSGALELRATGGQLRITERGELVNDRYGLSPIALRVFERRSIALSLSRAGVMRAGAGRAGLARGDGADEQGKARASIAAWCSTIPSSMTSSVN